MALALHPAISICSSCNKPMPKEALVCTCGELAMPAWQEKRPVTDARTMAVRLSSLADGIGWQVTAAGTVLLARCMYLALFIAKRTDTVSIEVFDEALGEVYSATIRCSMQQACRMAASAAAEYVNVHYGPQERSNRPPIKPDLVALQQKLERLKIRAPRGKAIAPGNVDMIISSYRCRNGLSSTRRAVRATRAIPDPDRTIPLGEPNIPWHRMQLEDCFTVDMGAVPQHQVSQAVRDLRTRRDDWKQKDKTRKKRNFIIWRQQNTIYVHRTA